MTTASGLAEIQVTLSRAGSPELSWDEEDSRHVVGWIVDHATGDRLPYEPWQAFGGMGDSLRPDRAGVALLPVRWITRDLQELPPGRYGITATLTSLNVETEPGELNLIRT